MLLLTPEVKCQVILLIFHVLVINHSYFCMLWRKKIFLFLQEVRVVLKQVMFLGDATIAFA